MTVTMVVGDALGAGAGAGAGVGVGVGVALADELGDCDGEGAGLLEAGAGALEPELPAQMLYVRPESMGQVWTA